MDSVTVNTTINGNTPISVDIPAKTGYKPISANHVTNIGSGTSGEYVSLLIGNPYYRKKDSKWQIKVLNVDSSQIGVYGTFNILYIKE